MRIILAIVALAAAAWTGWWFFIASAKERAVEAWLADRRAAGWVAEAAEVDVNGFPYRVDTTWRGLELADPELGWAWSAPDFQLLTLAYQPNHLIAVWPGAQRFSTPLGATDITADKLMGSLRVEPNARLALQNATIEMAGLSLAGDTGWTVGVAEGVLAARRAEGPEASPFAHDIALDAKGIALPADRIAGLDRGGLLAPEIETLRLDATADFDAPWDLPALEGATPTLLGLDIRDATLTWGALDLRARGSLVADDRGYAEGRLDVRARNWREMIDIAEETGALNRNIASGLRAGLGLLAQLSGDRNTLEAPLEFSRGMMRLGPVPLGPAPRLALR